MNLLAQSEQIVDGAGRVLDGAAQHGPVVYMAVFMCLGLFGITLVAMWGFNKFWLKPEQDRKLVQDQREQVEYESRLETNKVLQQTNQQIGNAILEQSKLMGEAASAAKLSVNQNSELLDMHKDRRSSFSVYYLEKIYLAKCRVFLDLISQLERADVGYTPNNHLKAIFEEEIKRLDKRVSEASN